MATTTLDDLRSLLQNDLESLGVQRQAKESDYETWLRTHFPKIASAPLGDRHHALWQWFERLGQGKVQQPRIDVWPRGGAKSSTAELGTAYVGVTARKRFVLFVSATQPRADERVQAVSKRLNSLGISAAVTKEGQKLGWRRDQLQADNGFKVAGIGLDVATRGIKIDEDRPDLIIVDDIDARFDTPASTAKKIVGLTEGIFPAGAAHCDILVLQNLIIEEGIVAQLTNGSAQFLADREVCGPEPAVKDLVVEDMITEAGVKTKRIVSGVPTWLGQTLAICQQQIWRWGWIAFKREAQHEVKGQNGFFFDVEKLNYVDRAPRLLLVIRAWDLAATQGGGDWTAGVLMGVAPNGNVYVLDVKRHQFSSDRVRRLLSSTAERDKKHEVWSADEVDYSGLVISQGVHLFDFEGNVTTRVPDDPGQAGTDQAQQLKAKLSESTTAQAVSPSGKKAVRARGFAEAVGNGNVYVVKGDWNHAFTEELRKFREDEQHDYDDQVDAAADAYNGLVKPRSNYVHDSGPLGIDTSTSEADQYA